jgi:hypothetical protein
MGHPPEFHAVEIGFNATIVLEHLYLDVGAIFLAAP